MTIFYVLIALAVLAGVAFGFEVTSPNKRFGFLFVSAIAFIAAGAGAILTYINIHTIVH
jgi:hypothetical protein